MVVIKSFIRALRLGRLCVVPAKLPTLQPNATGDKTPQVKVTQKLGRLLAGVNRRILAATDPVLARGRKSLSSELCAAFRGFEELSFHAPLSAVTLVAAYGL